MDEKVDIATIKKEAGPESDFCKTIRFKFNNAQGGRATMEDHSEVVFFKLEEKEHEQISFSWAFFGMFDGHGGKEVASYAQDHLLERIVAQPGFASTQEDIVCQAISDGFVSLHNEMASLRHSWPISSSGHANLSGTTASVAIIKDKKLYIANVGDSSIVLGCKDPTNPLTWKATQLTLDHKPDDSSELQRIEEAGGRVETMRNVARVVWDKPKLFKNRAGQILPVNPRVVEPSPFLNMGRALGDFWSWNEEKEVYIVSPVPDTRVIRLDPEVHRCIILGSDGLWNVISKLEAVNTVYCAELTNARRRRKGGSEVDFKPKMGFINPAERLVNKALDQWRRKKLKADNVTVITVAFL